jgi:hypothetical protein
VKIFLLPTELQKPGQMVVVRRHGKVNCIDSDGGKIVRCYHQWILGADVATVSDLKLARQQGWWPLVVYHVLPRAHHPPALKPHGAVVRTGGDKRAKLSRHGAPLVPARAVV